ncbi:MAG: TRAP transporter small permease [Microvirga sp.]|nr:TRAP transporter small permease [Microvirga sp.]
MQDTLVPAWPSKVVGALARINYGIAVICGVALLVTVVYVLAEILLRRFVGRGLGGTDEISGYVMAGVAAWGFSYALVERAHVRIDVLTGLLPKSGRSIFDLLALLSITFVATLVTYWGWRVLSTTLTRGSRSNTPLETPMWIPQSVWLAGWAWLTVVSVILAICLLALMIARSWNDAEAVAGVASEAGEEK